MAEDNKPTHTARIKDGEAFRDVGAGWQQSGKEVVNLRFKEAVPANTTIYIMKNKPKPATNG